MYLYKQFLICLFKNSFIVSIFYARTYFLNVPTVVVIKTTDFIFKDEY